MNSGSGWAHAAAQRVDQLFAPQGIFIGKMHLHISGQAFQPRSRIGNGACIKIAPRAPGRVVASSSAQAPPLEKAA